MVFYPPSWVPKLAIDPPDSVSIGEFMRDEKYGRCPLSESRNPFTCGITGRTYTTEQFFKRSECIARALSEKLGWTPNQDTCWDKVACIFSLNSIDYIAAIYGVHRLDGIVTPANAVYSAAELAHQLTSSGSKILFTCLALLETAFEAAHIAGLDRGNIFLMPMPSDTATPSHGLLTLEELVTKGEKYPNVEPLRWNKGQGARQPALLCYSSGTSGLPKAVMISHHNMIANVLQYVAYESVGRAKKGVVTQNLIAPLPQSHIFALMVASHCTIWRGDGYIVLPKYDLTTFLETIQKFKAEHALLVPPIVIEILRSQELCRKYDLSSIRFICCGAAPLGAETIQEVERLYPTWTIAQAYGMTETSVVVSSSSEHDVMTKAVGSLVPDIRVKIIDAKGVEVTEYDKPGEVLVQGPAVVLGYLNNEKATSETFVHHNDGRWIRTGDEGLMTLAPSGNEQLVIVDRIKELIKVKGHQVAPAELETHILAHPKVADCAVIQIPDERAGEIPKAFVVKNQAAAAEPDDELAGEIIKWVADHKASYKQIKGGVEFVEVVPKSPSGKILRRILRDREKEARRLQGAKL